MKMKCLFLLLLMCPSAYPLICPDCAKQKLKSTVTVEQTGQSTTLSCDGNYWDMNGNWVPRKPCNTCVVTYRCSNKHSWSEKVVCP